MRVLIDATMAKPERSGITVYCVEMVRALQQEVARPIVVTSVPEEFAAMPGVEVVAAPPATQGFAARAAWRERSIRVLMRTTRAEVLFVPAPELALRRLTRPVVVVVHDVTPLIAPAMFPRVRWARFAADMGRVCRRATRVVCVSESTRLALFGAVRVDPAKLVVVGEGAGNLEAAAGGVDGVRDLSQVLYVGSLFGGSGVPYRHKNILPLIEAFGGRVAGESAPRLTMVGPLENRGRETLERMLARAGATRRVEHLGFVDVEGLAGLYGRAGAVAYPSLTEGFGLPVLEAFARRAPVIASDIPAIREVGGAGVHYVRQALEPEAWRSAIARVLGDEHLRAELVDAGAAELRSHTWSAAARRLAMVLEEAVAT